MPESEVAPDKPQTTAELKIANRRRRVFELRCAGLKISQICEKLREEGQIWSERTVWSDLHSDQAGELIDELVRQQLSDIALCEDDYAIRLKFRDLLIEKLLPRKPSVKVDVNVGEKTDVAVSSGSDLLAEYDRHLRKVQAANLHQIHPEEPVDKT